VFIVLSFTVLVRGGLCSKYAGSTAFYVGHQLEKAFHSNHLRTDATRDYNYEDGAQLQALASLSPYSQVLGKPNTTVS
jgi:hypothetical protein